MANRQNTPKTVQVRFGDKSSPMCVVLNDKNQNFEISLDPQSGRASRPPPWIPPPCRTRIHRPCYPVNELIIGMPSDATSPGVYGAPFVIESSRLENFRASFFPYVGQQPQLVQPAVLTTEPKHVAYPGGNQELEGASVKRIASNGNKKRERSSFGDRRKVLNGYAESDMTYKSVPASEAIERSKVSVKLLRDSILSIQDSIKDLEERQKSMGKNASRSKNGASRDKIIRELSDIDGIQADMRKSISSAKTSILGAPYQNGNESNGVFYSDYNDQRVQQQERLQKAVPNGYIASREEFAEEPLPLERKTSGDNAGECLAHPLIRNKTCSECNFLSQKRRRSESRRQTFPSTFRERKNIEEDTFQRRNRRESIGSASVENMMTKLADCMRKSKLIVDSVCQQENATSDIQKKYIKNAEALYKEQQQIIQSICSAMDVGNNLNLPESGSDDSQKGSLKSKRADSDKNRRDSNFNKIMKELSEDVQSIKSEIEVKEKEIEKLKKSASKTRNISDDNGSGVRQSLNLELSRANSETERLKLELRKVTTNKKNLEMELGAQKSKIKGLYEQSKEFSFNPKSTSSRKSLDKQESDINWDEVESRLDKTVSDIVHKYSVHKGPNFRENKYHTVIDQNDRHYGRPSEFEGESNESEISRGLSNVEYKAKKMKEIMNHVVPLLKEKWTRKDGTRFTSLLMEHHEENTSVSLSDDSDKSNASTLRPRKAKGENDENPSNDSFSIRSARDYQNVLRADEEPSNDSLSSRSARVDQNVRKAEEEPNEKPSTNPFIIRSTRDGQNIRKAGEASDQNSSTNPVSISSPRGDQNVRESETIPKTANVSEKQSDAEMRNSKKREMSATVVPNNEVPQEVSGENLEDPRDTNKYYQQLRSSSEDTQVSDETDPKEHTKRNLEKILDEFEDSAKQIMGEINHMPPESFADTSRTRGYRESTAKVADTNSIGNPESNEKSGLPASLAAQIQRDYPEVVDIPREFPRSNTPLPDSDRAQQQIPPTSKDNRGGKHLRLQRQKGIPPTESSSLVEDLKKIKSAIKTGSKEEAVAAERSGTPAESKPFSGAFNMTRPKEKAVAAERSGTPAESKPFSGVSNLMRPKEKAVASEQSGTPAESKPFSGASKMTRPKEISVAAERSGTPAESKPYSGASNMTRPKEKAVAAERSGSPAESKPSSDDDISASSEVIQYEYSQLADPRKSWHAFDTPTGADSANAAQRTIQSQGKTTSGPSSDPDNSFDDSGELTQHSISGLNQDHTWAAFSGAEETSDAAQKILRSQGKTMSGPSSDTVDSFDDSGELTQHSISGLGQDQTWDFSISGVGPPPKSEYYSKDSVVSRLMDESSSPGRWYNMTPHSRNSLVDEMPSSVFEDDTISEARRRSGADRRSAQDLEAEAMRHKSNAQVANDKIKKIYSETMQ